MTNIDSNQDILDVRDIIERVEELREEFEDAANSDDPADVANLRDDAFNIENHGMHAEAYELAQLEELLSELAGNGGDEQWEGDWYPVTLIRDSYFDEAMDEMLEELGEIPDNLPSYLSITVDYKALQMDYSAVEFDGVTYWYR